MSTNTREMQCAPSDVFGVLANGWFFGLWVVGASRIRAVSGPWPEVGSEILHSVGAWPLMLNDTTSVVDYVPDRELHLRARAWPAGEADVRITAEPTRTGCRVQIIEDAVRGPGLLIPKVVRSLMLHWRNTETLRRLAYMAEQGASD